MKTKLENFRYSVAIRTLGLAGSKYQRELDSLSNQTIKPDKIIVYLAEGYDKPQETIGWEQMVYVKKGMIAQRALPYNEISTPYILLLDDDVFIPHDGVEKLAKGLLENFGDCIAADTFQNHKMPIMKKVLAFVSNWACPIYSNKWAIKLQHTGSFFYNNSPTKDVYLSQSAAGPCSLWKKQSLLKIHFTDELWLDRIGFAYEDDTLFFYKLHINGGKLLMHYTSGVIHLDAESSSKTYNEDATKLRKRAQALFLIWWRIDFNLLNIPSLYKIMSLIEYSLKFICNLIIHLILSLWILSYRPLFYYIAGNIDGFIFVHSEEYRKVPNFIVKDK